MTTLLISIGAASYPRAPALRHPSFERSSRAISTLLAAGSRALLHPARHLDLFDDQRTWPDQLMAIRGWLREMVAASCESGDAGRVENVVVHYVGHGMFRANSEQHYLSINTTDAEDRSMTSASLGELAGILARNAQAQRRFYLIDACFAAASTRNLMSVAEDAIEVRIGGVLGAWPDGEWGDSGVAALCSADRTATASADGLRGLTQFTDALVGTLEEGDARSEGSISLRRTYQLLRTRLRSQYGEDAVYPVLVAPEDRDGGIAGAPLFLNAALPRLGPSLPGPGLPSHDALWLVDPTRSGVDEISPRVTRGAMMLQTGKSEAVNRDYAPGEPMTSETEALGPDQRFRQAVYRFFRLPHSEKDEIVRSLFPAGAPGQAPSDLDHYKAVLAKARDAGVVERLECMIKKAEGK